MVRWVDWSGTALGYAGKAIRGAADVEERIEAAVREGLDAWLVGAVWRTRDPREPVPRPDPGEVAGLVREAQDAGFAVALGEAVGGAMPLVASLVGAAAPSHELSVVPCLAVLDALEAYFRLRLDGTAGFAGLCAEGADGLLLRLLAIEASRPLRDLARRLPRRKSLLLGRSFAHHLGERYNTPVFLLGGDDLFEWCEPLAPRGFLFGLRADGGDARAVERDIAEGYGPIRREMGEIRERLGRKTEAKRRQMLAAWRYVQVVRSGDAYRVDLGQGLPGRVQ